MYVTSVLLKTSSFGILKYKTMDDQAKVLKYLVSAEKLAEEILSDRREIVLLDKRRNANREALRDLSKSGQQKCWVTVGSVLIKNDLRTTKDLLDEDQKQLNIDINKLRSDLRVKVNDLRDLEMQPPVPGLMLVPMSRKETEGFSCAGLFT
ncbi:p53 and DNA damage-regulated protein 1 [Pectinophora gossypiella]|uniref:p53 and DNA damage-regulated protein 1 n=1 Tax=Pectinophora gossypiella TaxID=13191 RepID=UPI00214E142B|nr:p53 and DNA damage-regulated protein 1 [Pectinophora gossypiella]